MIRDDDVDEKLSRNIRQRSAASTLRPRRAHSVRAKLFAETFERFVDESPRIAGECGGRSGNVVIGLDFGRFLLERGEQF